MKLPLFTIFASLGGLCAAHRHFHSAASYPMAFCYDNSSSTTPNLNAFTTAYHPYVLGDIMNLAEDVAIFRFLLQTPETKFSLIPCSTLQCSLKQGGNMIDRPMRFYTPITENGQKGYFDILVKKQKGGRVTEHLFSMSVGDTLLWRLVQYKLKYRPNRWKTVGMLAGGTGITPLLQFLRTSLQQSTDKTNFSLLFANKSEEKILLKGMLDKLASDFSDRFKSYYTIDTENSTPDWKGYVGHIDAKMIRATMPPPGDDIMLLVCGPDAFMNSLVGTPWAVLKAMSGGLAYQPSGTVLNNVGDVAGILGSLGYEKEMVYRF